MPANTEKMRKYTAAPHPFVLRFPQSKTQVDFLYTLDVVLFGHGQRYFPYIVHALQTAGNNGIGGQRQLFSLQKIDDLDHQGNSQTIYQQAAIQSIIKTQQSEPLPFYSGHTLASPWLESAALRYQDGKFCVKPPVNLQ